MKTTSLKSGKHALRIFTFFLAFITIGMITPVITSAQIYEPEGLNLPGAWNGWTNPPANNLALASSTQVTGGKVIKITGGTIRWQTILHVASAGGDVTPGTFTWLFTSGPLTNAFQNKWAGVNVIVDSLQLYTKEGTADNSVTLEDTWFYTINWEDAGYANTHAIFMKTSATPVTVDSVTVPASVSAGIPAQIDIQLSNIPCAQENIFLRYSTDAWTTSATIKSTQITGSTATVQIPGQPNGTVVAYYAFTSVKGNIQSDFDMYAIHLNNHGGANYSYTVGGGAPAISFANLQNPASGIISPLLPFDVYGQAYIAGITGQATPAPGLQAWVGYNTADTDPATWSNWLTATFYGPSGNNDEFKADLGSALTSAGTYFYATRFKYNSDPYVYGGYSVTGGGFWNGTTNVSGKLDILVGVPDKDKLSVTIAPNPASDFIRINVPSATFIEIMDISGKIIQTNQLVTGTNVIGLESLQAGIFHVRFRMENQTLHGKFIKY